MERYHDPSKVLRLFQKLVSQDESFERSITEQLVLLKEHPNFPELDKPNLVLFKLPVLPIFANMMKNIHGGAVGTIIDIVTTVGILANDPKARLNVSVQLNVNYLNSAAVGDEIFMLCRTDKVGKKLGTATCEIYSDKRQLLYTGTHIKSFLNDSVFSGVGPKL